MAKNKHIGQQSIRYEEPPYIIGCSSIVGKKEGEGPLAKYFDCIEEDPMCGGSAWEEAEGNLQERAVQIALNKAGIEAKEIDYLVAGDLQDQLTASTFGIAKYQIPLFGVYGACSTMGESMALASMMVEAGFANRTIAVTSSHTEAAFVFLYLMEIKSLYVQHGQLQEVAHLSLENRSWGMGHMLRLQELLREKSQTLE